MMPRRTSLAAVTLAAMVTVSARASAEPPAKKEIPEALLPILASAEDALSADDPKRALEALARWKGDPDSIHALLRGAAHQALSQQAEAEAAYRAALALDPELRAARVGLARALVAQRSWNEAAEVLGALVDVEKGTAPELGLYARVAFERGDLRLASLLVERGMVRFPNDRGFRRLDVALALERGDWTTAREAARALLAQNPGDGRVWRQLAAAVERVEADDLVRLATLEAAALANPGDAGLTRRHALAQLEAGHAMAALAVLEPRIEARPQDAELLELGARIADAAGVPERARGWLARVPEDARSEAMRLLEARLALDAGEDAAARRALEALIRSGRASSQVYLWAGQLAERAGDFVEAEAAYGQAASAKDPAGQTATLYLASLLSRRAQPERAREILTVYLAAHPEDRAARALLEVIAGARE